MSTQHNKPGDDPRRKIKDVNEFKSWYNEGLSYREMAERFEEKYGEKVTQTAFSNLRRRLNPPARLASRDTTLIPWQVRQEHLSLLPMRMLHTQNRLDRRMHVTPEQISRLNDWKAKLKEHGVVLHYEPETEQGFFYVPARKKDTGLIRIP